MTTYTIFSGSGDGRSRQVSTVYATAVAGSGTASSSTSGSSTGWGQTFSNPDYTLTQIGWPFDTSSIDDAETVSAVTLSLYCTTAPTTTNWTAEAFDYDWNPTYGTGSWRTDAQLGALTKLATFAFTTGMTVNAYVAFTSLGPFPAFIKKTATSYIVCASADNRTATAPTGSGGATTMFSESTDQDPKLEITAAVAGASTRGRLTLLGVG